MILVDTAHPHRHRGSVTDAERIAALTLALLESIAELELAHADPAIVAALRKALDDTRN